jgi:hypothetical protein
MTAIEAAELAGIDLSLVEENLRLTPEQRALQHDSALELALAMEAAGRKLRDAAEPTYSTPLRS